MDKDNIPNNQQNAPELQLEQGEGFLNEPLEPIKPNKPNEDNKPLGAIVGAKEVAKLFKVDIGTVRRWKRMGCPVYEIPGVKKRAHQFDLPKVRQWMKDNHITGEPGHPFEKDLTELKKIRLRREKALADLAEMKRDREKKLLVLASEVESDNIKKFTTIRNNLLGVAAAISPSLEGLNAAQIQSELEKRIEEILTILSKS